MESTLNIINEIFYILITLSPWNLVCILYLHQAHLNSATFQVLRSYMWIVSSQLDIPALSSACKQQPGQGRMNFSVCPGQYVWPPTSPTVSLWGRYPCTWKWTRSHQTPAWRGFKQQLLIGGEVWEVPDEYSTCHLPRLQVAWGQFHNTASPICSFSSAHGGLQSFPCKLPWKLTLPSPPHCTRPCFEQ